MSETSHFFKDDQGEKHLVITYCSGWETICKKRVTKDNVFEANSDFSSRIVTCGICLQALDTQ